MYLYIIRLKFVCPLCLQRHAAGAFMPPSAIVSYCDYGGDISASAGQRRRNISPRESTRSLRDFGS